MRRTAGTDKALQRAAHPVVYINYFSGGTLKQHYAVKMVAYQFFYNIVFKHET